MMSDVGSQDPLLWPQGTDHIWTIGEIMMMLVVPESNNA